MNQRLKTIVEDNTTRPGLLFDRVVVLLIAVGLVSYAIETLPTLDPVTKQLLKYVEVTIVTLFTVEYLLRIYVADRPSKFAFSFFGAVDLLAILPFYLALVSPYFLALGLDLRFLRIVRLLRLFRALKLVRYSRAIQLFSQAFRLAKEELILFFVVALMLLYFSAAFIYFFENPGQPEAFSSIFTSLWWAVVTLTTVGYGDVYPMTDGGRIFTFFLLLVGLGTIAVPSGIVASALSKAREMRDEGDR